MNNFELKILKQYWIDNDTNNNTDLCSHGLIYLSINSQEILTEEDQDWTISTSVLLLLRTLFQDHSPNDRPSLILHCGMLSMLSCPISVSWRVKHKGKRVIISEVRKCPTVNSSDTINFPKASLEFELREYAIPILKCAEDVEDFFLKSKKRKFFDDYDQNDYKKFWEEFSELRFKAQDIV